MYDDFSDAAHAVIHLANREASRFYHEYIGTEHLLLALFAEETGIANTVLKKLNVDADRVRRDVELIIQPGPTHDVSLMSRPLTPRATKALEFAIDEAARFHHPRVGPEHILLGLLREDEGVANQVLRNRGLDLEGARKGVLIALGQAVDTAVLEAEVKHLPGYAREIARTFAVLIDLMERGKEGLVADQDFDRAAALRDLEIRLRKYRDRFINEWPKGAVKES